MSRLIRPPFQVDRPLFVKVPSVYKGKQYKQGDQLKWKEQNLDRLNIEVLYLQDYLYHNEELEEKVAKPKVGDGLQDLDIDALHALVEEINVKVKAQTKSNGEFIKKKCPTSTVKDKQVGYIRRWRLTYGHFE